MNKRWTSIRDNLTNYVHSPYIINQRYVRILITDFRRRFFAFQISIFVNLHSHFNFGLPA